MLPLPARPASSSRASARAAGLAAAFESESTETERASMAWSIESTVASVREGS